MKPEDLGKKYDKIAAWWQEYHKGGNHGVASIQKAMGFRSEGGSALDVGCGAGGRIVHALQKKHYKITGLDVSRKMIELAVAGHPNERFVHQDVCTWKSTSTFDFIVAWDSIFHLPHHEQEPVVSKLCRLLNKDGVLAYTFGNGQGEHTDTWRDDTFYYSSIGINDNIRLLIENGLTVMHLELDQYPEKHVYIVAKKL